VTFRWPRFRELGWSASFESYDQYRDNLYYVITMNSGGPQFVAEIDISGVRDDADHVELGAHVRAELHKVAALGHTNTAYAPTNFDL
jgi:hypothetical protein